MTEPSLAVPAAPEREPSEVTVQLPAGHHLAAIPQMIIGSLEMSLDHEIIHLMQVRQTIHEIVCHLDRVVPPGSPIELRASATGTALSVVLRAEVPESAGSIDSWLLGEAEERFEVVEIEHLDGRITVRLRSSARDQ